MMQENGKIQVVTRGQFGICPICGERMKLLISTFDGYNTFPSGLPKSVAYSITKYHMACKCGFSMEMVRNPIDGLVPRNYIHKTPEYTIDKENPIGIVCG